MLKYFRKAESFSDKMHLLLENLAEHIREREKCIKCWNRKEYIQSFSVNSFLKYWITNIKQLLFYLLLLVFLFTTFDILSNIRHSLGPDDAGIFKLYCIYEQFWTHLKYLFTVSMKHNGFIRIFQTCFCQSMSFPLYFVISPLYIICIR